MNTLHLTLKRKWFEMIYSGEKREEYRECKPYWTKRLSGPKRYDAVQFRNGYGRHSPVMRLELIGLGIGYGRQEWGAPADRVVFVFNLGKRLPLSEPESP
jgi:hypothetical protein